MEEPLPQIEIHKGTFHMVTVTAVQNLLFMMRVASACVPDYTATFKLLTVNLDLRMEESLQSRAIILQEVAATVL